jgi:hypothetical protein
VAHVGGFRAARRALNEGRLMPKRRLSVSAVWRLAMALPSVGAARAAGMRKAARTVNFMVTVVVGLG